MAVADTSIEAFKKYVASGQLKTHREKVYECVARLGGMSREEIAEITGIKLSSVCRPVMELVREGVLSENERGVSQISGHTVKIVALNEGQLSLI